MAMGVVMTIIDSDVDDDGDNADGVHDDDRYYDCYESFMKKYCSLNEAAFYICSCIV